VHVVCRRNKRILQARRQAGIERRLRDRSVGRERTGGMMVRDGGPPIPRVERGDREVRDV
jgi:hypothetical protein